ncbi:hypothetical protein B0H10DRAFT_1938271 [Mycena sp. CBHHK59/15]|nr:hypothetical protein B0H10DRAFT_1938271 [Mycena sp. CBHHK59/15]
MCSQPRFTSGFFQVPRVIEQGSGSNRFPEPDPAITKQGIRLGWEGVVLAKATCNIYIEAQCLDLQARCFARMGKYALAAECCGHDMELIMVLGSDQTTLIGRDMMNAHEEILLQKTEYRETREIYVVTKEMGNTSGFGQIQLVYFLINLAVIDAAIGDLAEVQEYINTAWNFLTNIYDLGQGQAVRDLPQADLDLRLMRLEELYQRGLAFHRGNYAEMTVCHD